MGVSHRVLFSPEAQRDLEGLYDYIADRASPETAMAYVTRIEIFCLTFADFPTRGTARYDLRPGLRVVGFERRVTIAFHISGDRVIIDRALYGGRDLDTALG